MSYTKRAGDGEFIFVALALALACLAAYVTHVIVCIKTSAWVLLAFGCLAFPIGIIHGFAVWCGAL